MNNNDLVIEITVNGEKLPIIEKMRRTQDAYAKDVIDLKHEMDSLCEDLVAKDQLIEKMTYSLESKDARIAILESELNNLTK